MHSEVNYVHFKSIRYDKDALLVFNFEAFKDAVLVVDDIYCIRSILIFSMFYAKSAFRCYGSNISDTEFHLLKALTYLVELYIHRTFPFDLA